MKGVEIYKQIKKEQRDGYKQLSSLDLSFLNMLKTIPFHFRFHFSSFQKNELGNMGLFAKKTS